MSWENISFTKPQLLVSKLGNANTQLAGKVGELNSIPGTLSSTPTIDSGGTSDALPLLGDSDLHGYTTAHYRCVFVHPWCEGIGQGNGHYRYLAPANAIEAAANKLIDANDSLKPTQNMDALAFLVSGASSSEMYNKLSVFIAAFKHPDILMCANRFKSLAVLEKAKEILPDAQLNASWKAQSLCASNSVKNYVAAVGDALAFVHGYECDSQSAEHEIAMLAQKKSQQITNALGHATTELNKLTGSVGSKIFYANKSPAAIKRELLSSGLGYDSPLSVCLVITGDVGSLENIRGMF